MVQAGLDIRKRSMQDNTRSGNAKPTAFHPTADCVLVASYGLISVRFGYVAKSMVSIDVSVKP